MPDQADGFAIPLADGFAGSPVASAGAGASIRAGTRFTGSGKGLYNEDMARKRAREFSYSVFYEQAPEGGYVALVPALPGCHTQGETLEEAERNVKEAIALYLESLAAHGEPIPEEGHSLQGRVTVPVSVPA